MSLVGVKWSERFLTTRDNLLSLISGSELNYPGFYVISDAVSGGKVIKVDVAAVNLTTTRALNITDNTLGVYDITADTFTPDSLPAASSFPGYVLANNQILGHVANSSIIEFINYP